MRRNVMRNLGEAMAPNEIVGRSICIDADINEIFLELAQCES